MPFAEIATGLASAKTLASLLKGAKDVRDSVKFSEIVIEAQQVILSLQESLLETQEKIDSLVKAKAETEASLVNREEWRERAKNYPLVEVRSGLFAYKFNPEAEDVTTPAHWACPKCFAGGQIQILQQPNPNNSKRKCFHCDMEVDFSEYERSSPTVTGRTGWVTGF